MEKIKSTRGRYGDLVKRKDGGRDKTNPGITGGGDTGIKKTRWANRVKKRVLY